MFYFLAIFKKYFQPKKYFIQNQADFFLIKSL